MALRQEIETIRAALKAGEFGSEAAISHGVVMRLLQSLGWPVYDPMIVIPEYKSGKGRVDFALCHPKQKAAVFIEVKRVGEIEGADVQLFEYAFHEGVPFAVLTDGQNWQFYLPAEQGHYDERRVYKLDLVERSSEDSETRLERYLRYSLVCDGMAIENARADHKNAKKQKAAEEAIPKAWQKLLEEGDSDLIDLLIEQVEDISGYKPDIDTVSDFIEAIAQKTQDTPPFPIPKPPAVKVKGNGLEYMLLGQRRTAKAAIDVVVEILLELQKKDQTFLQRYTVRKHGKKRRWVAHTADELYPGRPDLKIFSQKLTDNFVLGTNYANREKLNMIKLACEIAGLKFGKDIVVNF